MPYIPHTPEEIREMLAVVGVSDMGTLATVIVAEGWTRDRAETFMFPHPTVEEVLRSALLGEMKTKE